MSRRHPLIFLCALSFYDGVARSEPTHRAGNPAESEAQTRAFFQSLPPTEGSIDIAATVGNTSSACQATPIENVKIAEAGMCRLVLFTAAHCVSAYLRASDSQRSFHLPRTDGKDLSFAKDRLQIFTHQQLSNSGSTKADPFDSALIVYKAPCFKIAFIRPVELGAVQSDGTVVASNPLSFQKRTARITDPILDSFGRQIGESVTNPGGGIRLQGSFAEKEIPEGSDRWYGQLGYRIPSPQGHAIVGGDSGGGIFDSLGRLVGAISGSTVPEGTAAGSTFQVSFDSTGIQWAKQRLAQLNGNSPGQTNPPTSSSIASNQGGAGSVTASQAPILSGSLTIAQAQGQTQGPEASTSAPSIGFSASPANGLESVVPGFPASDVQYFVGGQWLDHIPLNPAERVIAINGERVPSGATGYRFGQGGGVQWVGPNQGIAGMNIPTFSQPTPPAAAVAPAPSFVTNSIASAQGAPRATAQPSSPTLRLFAGMPSSFPAREPAAASPIVRKYENGMFYIGGQHPRERFPADMFTDIPQGGTGKIRLAYFGPRDLGLEQALASNPIVEARWYPPNSPEAFHANLFGVQALGVDGLGRKITRYAFNPRMALENLMQDEVPLLRDYLAAKSKPAR